MKVHRRSTEKMGRMKQTVAFALLVLWRSIISHALLSSGPDSTDKLFEEDGRAKCVLTGGYLAKLPCAGLIPSFDVTANGTSLRASDGSNFFHIKILENLLISVIYTVEEAGGSALTFHLLQTAGSGFATCDGSNPPFIYNPQQRFSWL